MGAAPIDAIRVGRRVETLGFDWHYRDETGSTNADALQHHARHRRDVVAFGETQTAGRGRRGRDWLSPHARNIYCTVGVERTLEPARQGLLSIVTGVALCAALRDATGLEVQLKWPNDLLLDGRKFGGILIESRSLADERFLFAVGYGLNLTMSDDELAALDRPATSLGHHFEAALDRSSLLEASIEAVASAIRVFDPVAVESLIHEFACFDAYRDTCVEVISGDISVQGINRGIDDRGQLRLETGRGIELHSAAEISLRRVTP